MSANPGSDPTASALIAPLAPDRVASPRLVYGGLDIFTTNGTDPEYPALYFDVLKSDELGRVTFEGLDSIRGSRGEYLPWEADRYEPDIWVYVVEGSSWLRERHAYESHHYSTPMLDTHRHYVFQFHDEFVEAVAEGIWFDIADREDPFAPPVAHPLAAFPLDMPAERFTSADGLSWELRRSPRADSDLVQASAWCSQRAFQLNLVLDGVSRETASIWIRTVDGNVVSRFSRQWPIGEVARLDGFAQPDDFTAQWETYPSEVAERRRQR